VGPAAAPTCEVSCTRAEVSASALTRPLPHLAAPAAAASLEPDSSPSPPSPPPTLPSLSVTFSVDEDSSASSDEQASAASDEEEEECIEQDDDDDDNNGDDGQDVAGPSSSFSNSPENVHQHHRPADALTSAVRRAVTIVREGGKRALSRAASSLLQRSLARIDDSTIEKLRQLHPSPSADAASPSISNTPIPCNRAVDLVAIEQKQLFDILRQRVDNGSAPGPSGWTGSHLTLIATSNDEEAVAGLCLLVKDICNGIFGGGTQQRLLSCVLTPISKNVDEGGGGGGRGGPGGIRPIAMGEVFVKLAAHYAMSLISDAATRSAKQQRSSHAPC
jgi:hypothetical protein